LSKTLSGPPDPAFIHRDICSPNLGLKITEGSLRSGTEPALSNLGRLEEVLGLGLHEARRFLGERTVRFEVDVLSMELVICDAFLQVVDLGPSFSSWLTAWDSSDWNLEGIVDCYRLSSGSFTVKVEGLNE
jgi:hypothetical protein